MESDRFTCFTPATLFFPNTNGYLNWDTFLSSNFVMRSIFAKRKSSVTNVRLFTVSKKYCDINLCMLRSSINIQLQCIKRSNTWEETCKYFSLSISTFSISSVLVTYPYCSWLRINWINILENSQTQQYRQSLFLT